MCLCDSRGRPDFRTLHAEMRQKRPDVSRMAFFAFDLLFESAVVIAILGPEIVELEQV